MNLTLVKKNTDQKCLYIILDYAIGIWTCLKFSYITNDEGTDLLKLPNGHKFRREAKFRDHIDWVCVNNSQKINRCTARLAINNDQKIKLSRAKHNHEPK